MIEKYFCFLLIVHFSCCASDISQPKKVYVNEGETEKLHCSLDHLNGSSWIGPCLYETFKCYSNKSTYYDGLMKYPDISNSISLQSKYRRMDVLYDLQISNITLENRGIYICTGFRDHSIQTKKLEVLFKVKPTNISFDKMSTDGRIHGTEGVVIELVCSVSSGIPEETMTLQGNHSIVSEGGPGEIRYSFNATQYHHNKTFTCLVYSEALDEPLEKTVTLDIKYRPRVTFVDPALAVVEGDNFTLQCLSDSNPSTTLILMKKDYNSTVIKKCTNSNCKMKLIGFRHDSGTYRCSAQNEVGKSITTSTVRVLYPPDVKVYSFNKTTLRCMVKGEPNNSTYVAWKHTSEKGKMIRSLKGSEYLALNPSCKRYIVNGVYVCEATNGIPDMSRNNVTSGCKSIKLLGIPEILPKTKEKQYAKYKDPATIQILIYSVPEITSAKILKHGAATSKSVQILVTTDISEEMFGKNVAITGYNMRFDIPALKETDFTNYTFMVANDIGSVNYTVCLIAKDVPLAPEIDLVSVENCDILVKFRRNLNGGSAQIFVVEYRPSFAQNWTTAVLMNDSNGEIISYRIEELEPDVEYCVQVYSRNTVGCSNSSTVCSLRTLANAHDLYLFIALGVGLSLILSVTTFVLAKGRDVSKWLVKKFEIHENIFVEDQQEQLDYVAVENQVYLSFDSQPRIQIGQENGYAYRNATTSRRMSSEDQSLNYAELEFSEVSQPFYIHGGDRTIYSEIDHSLTAPPLESSDSEQENDDEDDFMSIEEIAEFMREKGLTPSFDD